MTTTSAISVQLRGAVRLAERTIAEIATTGGRGPRLPEHAAAVMTRLADDVDAARAVVELARPGAAHGMPRHATTLRAIAEAVAPDAATVRPQPALAEATRALGGSLSRDAAIAWHRDPMVATSALRNAAGNARQALLHAEPGVTMQQLLSIA